jgi:hypothetical protein
MKIIEISPGLSTHITNEESDLLLQFDDKTPTIAKHTLDDRQQMIANHLVNKNILLRKNENNQLIYKKRIR